MALKRENQRILLTRRLLQEGLLRLLEVKELEKISVTELCREAGINRATFYNHYDSPQALLAGIEAGIRQDLEEMTSMPTSPEDAAQQLERICVYLKAHARLINILRRCHADEELAYAFSDLSRYSGFRQNSDLDETRAQLAATYLHTGCYYMIREWLEKDIDMTPREIAQLAMHIINKELL